MDLLKTFVGKSELSLVRNGNHAIIKLNSNSPTNEIISKIPAIMRHEMPMIIPLCFYIYKEKIDQILNKVSEISGAILHFEIKQKPIIYINGNERESTIARNMIFEEINQWMIDDSFVCYAQPSRILNRCNDSDKNFFYTFEVEQMKLYFCLSFYREKIEDCLASHNSYILLEDNEKLKIISMNQSDLNKCQAQIIELFAKVVRIESSKPFDSSEGTSMIINNYKNRRFLILGITSFLKSGVVSDMEYSSELIVDTKIGDFLCGKKSGKINKIMKETNCSIKYFNAEPLMIFDIRGSGEALIHSLELIFEEFPVEGSFTLDKKHHRRIIGSCGKNIQSIMKKHDVYVKFMNDHEAGSDGNVTMKTPMKNKSSLEKIKAEILEAAGCSYTTAVYENESLIIPKNASIKEICFNHLKVDDSSKYYIEDSRNISKPIKLGNKSFVYSNMKLKNPVTALDWNSELKNSSKNEKDGLSILENIFDLIDFDKKISKKIDIN